MKAFEIKKRRLDVARLLKNGYSEDEIANKLQMSVRNVVRDVSYLKKSSAQWLDDLASDGFVFECKNVIEKIDETCRRLEDLLKDADMWQKISIYRTIDANRKLRLEILSEYPTLYAYRKATKLNQGNVSQS